MEITRVLYFIFSDDMQSILSLVMICRVQNNRGSQDFSIFRINVQCRSNRFILPKIILSPTPNFHWTVSAQKYFVGVGSNINVNQFGPRKWKEDGANFAKKGTTQRRNTSICTTPMCRTQTTFSLFTTFVIHVICISWAWKSVEPSQTLQYIASSKQCKQRVNKLSFIGTMYWVH